MNLRRILLAFDKACDEWTELLHNCQETILEKCHQSFENYQDMVRFSLDCNERAFKAIQETTIQNRELLLNAFRSSICEVNDVC